MCTRVFLAFIAPFLIVFAQDCHINESLAKSIPAPDLWDPQIAYDMNGNDSYLYIFDGTAWDRHIYEWNIPLNDWRIIPSVLSAPFDTNEIPFRSPVTNAVTINRIVYFIGMYEYDDIEPWTSGNVYLFNLDSQSWMDNTNINKPEYKFIMGCLAHNESHIFMVGGDDKDYWTDRLQIYDIAGNLWTDELMNFDWSGQACQVVNDYLYVFGGFGGPLYAQLDIIAKYHATHKWTEITPPLPHTQERAVALHYAHTPFIYIIGGMNNDQTWDSIFAFNVDTDTITHTYTMAKVLSEFTAAIIGSKLYIFSAFDYNKDMLDTDVEICDILPETSTPNPTLNPSMTPTNPTSLPTTTPTQVPTLYPTETPTNNPIVSPTKSPTRSPSAKPSISSLTMHPTVDPATIGTEGTPIRIITSSHKSTNVDDDFRSTNNANIVIVYVNNTGIVLIVLVVVIGVLVVIVALGIIGIVGYKKKVTKNNQMQMNENVQVSQFEMNENDTTQAVVVVEEGLKVTDEGIAERQKEGDDSVDHNKGQHVAAVTKTAGAISPGNDSYNIEHDEFVVKGDDEMIDTIQ